MPRVTKAQREAEQQRMALVDEYGRLEAETAPLKTKLRRLEELAKIVRSWHEDADANTAQKSAGTGYEVVLSARDLRTHLAPMEEIFAALGKTKFLACCSVTVKALEAAAGPETFAALASKERTGPRTLTVRSLAA